MDDRITAYAIAKYWDRAPEGLKQYYKQLARGLANKPDGYVLALDFDGVLHDGEWPGIGQPEERLIAGAAMLRACGIKLVLWTCREGSDLDKAVAWSALHGLEYDAINDNTKERKALYGNNPRKIGYDELWDDRVIRVNILGGGR